jgi:hypothetical protein
MNEENRRAISSFGEGDSPAPPIESTLFATNEIGELVDALSGKRIISRGGAKESAPGHEDPAPAIIVFFHRWKLSPTTSP